MSDRENASLAVWAVRNLNAGDGCLGGEFVVEIVDDRVKVGVQVELKVENVLLLNLEILFRLPYGGVDDLCYFQQLANRVTVGLERKRQFLCRGSPSPRFFLAADTMASMFYRTR